MFCRDRNGSIHFKLEQSSMLRVVPEDKDPEHSGKGRLLNDLHHLYEDQSFSPDCRGILFLLWEKPGKKRYSRKREKAPEKNEKPETAVHTMNDQIRPVTQVCRHESVGSVWITMKKEIPADHDDSADLKIKKSAESVHLRENISTDNKQLIAISFLLLDLQSEF